MITKDLIDACRFQFYVEDKIHSFVLTTKGTHKGSLKADFLKVHYNRGSEYIGEITLSIRKTLNEDKSGGYFPHKVCLATQQGDFIVYDSWEDFEDKITTFFKENPLLCNKY